MADDEDINVRELGPVFEEVLRHQARSVLHAALVAGSLTGLEAQAVAARVAAFAGAELEDFSRLVSKAHALGVLRTLPVDIPVASTSETSLRELVQGETAAIATLHAVIPLTGQRPESEALEHLLEHVIHRKQEQLEFLHRALG